MEKKNHYSDLLTNRRVEYKLASVAVNFVIVYFLVREFGIPGAESWFIENKQLSLALIALTASTINVYYFMMMSNGLSPDRDDLPRLWEWARKEREYKNLFGGESVKRKFPLIISMTIFFGFWVYFFSAVYSVIYYPIFENNLKQDSSFFAVFGAMVTPSFAYAFLRMVLARLMIKNLNKGDIDHG